jgi:hypothetical protein
VVVDKPGKFELVFTPSDGSAPKRFEVFNFKSSGVALGMYNTDEVGNQRCLALSIVVVVFVLVAVVIKMS